MKTFINKKFLFFILLLGSITFCQAMEQSDSNKALTIAQQLTKNAQLFLQPLEGQQPSSLTLNSINSLAQQLANNYTQAEWNNDYETAQAIRDSIRLSLIDNLMRAGAHDALTNLTPILTPKKDESPSLCYTKIQQALSIPLEVYNAIAQARITGRWEELLELKQRPGIQGTPSEQFLTQILTEFMKVYPCRSLVKKSLNATALSFNTLVEEGKWEIIEKKLKQLPEELSIRLINAPINEAGNTLLHEYVIKGNITIVEQLLAWGANTEILNYYARCPVCYAYTAQHNEDSKKLIELLEKKSNKHCTSCSHSLHISQNPDSLNSEQASMQEEFALYTAIRKNDTNALLNENSVKDFSILLKLHRYVKHFNNWHYVGKFRDVYHIIPSDFLEGAIDGGSSFCIKQLILQGLNFTQLRWNPIEKVITSGITTKKKIKFINLFFNSGAPLPSDSAFLNSEFLEADDLHIPITTFLKEKGFKFNFTKNLSGWTSGRTLLELALLHKKPTLVNFIVNEAQEQKINLNSLVKNYGLQLLFVDLHLNNNSIRATSRNAEIDQILRMLFLDKNIILPDGSKFFWDLGYSSLYRLLIREMDNNLRTACIKKLLSNDPSLKTQPDACYTTPLDYIMRNPELAQNQELISLFK